MEVLFAPFRVDRSFHAPLLAAFIAINAITATNGLLHDARVGYDARGHLAYIDALSQRRLPTADESNEFFAAPLAYVPPAVVAALLPGHPGWSYKAAQLLNVVYGCVLAFFLVRICRAAFPDRVQVATWALLLLASITAYHKTLAFVRGEPLTALVAVVAADLALAGGLRARQRSIALGVAGGLLLLAKQWGVFVLLALVIFEYRRSGLKASAVVATIAALIASPFYASLAIRHGSPLAFNEPLSPVGVNRDLRAFTTVDVRVVLTTPVREALSVPTPQVWSILYSEMWGDYDRYWLVVGRDPDGGPATGDAYQDPDRRVSTNLPAMAHYLGRVNLAAAVPTMILLGGLILGLRHAARSATRSSPLALAGLVCGVSITGYVLMLAWLPELGIKPSYLLQVMPFMAMLGAAWIDAAERRRPTLAWVIRMAFGVAALHNAPAWFSRYSLLGGFTEWH